MRDFEEFEREFDGRGPSRFELDAPLPGTPDEQAAMLAGYERQREGSEPGFQAAADRLLAALRRRRRAAELRARMRRLADGGGGLPPAG